MTRFGIQSLVERVQQEVERNGLRPFSRKTGLPIGVVRSIAAGRDPSVSNLKEMALALGMEFYVGPPRALNTEPQPDNGISNEIDLARIRLHDVQASAGPGLMAADGQVLTEIGFPTIWLGRHGISPDQSSLIYVDGDSMAPTIEDGAIVLIDHTRTELRRKRVYAFREGDELYVKRLERIGDQVIIISDNPDHEARLVGGADLEFFSVLGEVVWSGKDWR